MKFYTLLLAGMLMLICFVLYIVSAFSLTIMILCCTSLVSAEKSYKAVFLFCICHWHRFLTKEYDLRYHIFVLDCRYCNTCDRGGLGIEDLVLQLTRTQSPLLSATTRRLWLCQVQMLDQAPAMASAG